MWGIRTLFSVGFLFSLVSAGCAAPVDSNVAEANVVELLSGSVADGYARAYEPVDFTFPGDHGAHEDFQTEWWYYTGNLAADSGSEYGYQLTFFRSAIDPESTDRASDYATNQIYMGHLALTDVDARRHESFELFSRGGGGLAGATGDPAYQVWIEDWSAEEIEPGVVALRGSAYAEDGPVSIDLELRETRPTVFHGDRGLSQKGPEPGNANYYYSMIGLDTRGTVEIGGRSETVGGVSWMDHEFGTSALSGNAVGWDWFSVQLDNDAALMFAQIRTEDGESVGDFEGTLVWADGTQESISASDLNVDVLDSWTSGETGITYPSGWQVDIPSHQIELDILPLLQDQEMTVSYTYWEGAVEAEGEMNGEPVAGRGFVELTGYGSDRGGYQR